MRTCTIFLILCAATESFATSSHQVDKLKVVKRASKVVGANIHVLIKPDPEHKNVVVGLGRPGKCVPNYRTAVKDPKAGYIIRELGTVPVDGKPLEHVFQVEYGDGPDDLKPGVAVEIYSIWDNSHVWGARRFSESNDPVYTLPGQVKEPPSNP